MNKLIITTAIITALAAPALAGGSNGNNGNGNQCQGNSCGGDTGPKGPKGDTGPRGETGPKGKNGDPGPQGAAGTNGMDGRDGTNGLNAVARYSKSQDAADRGLGSLQTRTAKAGQWTGALGLAGSDDLDAIAGGVRYGFTDRVDGYAVLSVPFSGSDVAWGVGVTFVLGGK